MESIQRSSDPSSTWAEVTHLEAGYKFSKYPKTFAITDHSSALNWLSSVINRKTKGDDTVSLEKPQIKGQFTFRIKTGLGQANFSSLIRSAAREEQPHLRVIHEEEEVSVRSPAPDCDGFYDVSVDLKAAAGTSDGDEEFTIVELPQKNTYLLSLQLTKV